MKSAWQCVLILAVASFACGRAAAAQSGGVPTLEPIVVTATRVPQPYGVVSSRVTVIEGDELRARGIRFVSEALAEIGGAEISQAGSFGAVASLFLRGGESDYVKVLVDGVPVNQPGGSFDFSGLTTENVARIEVVQGPSGVLYGSDAIAGVVQIFTRDGGAGRSGSLSLQAGNHGSQGGSASLAGGSREVGYSLAVGDFRSAGIYTNDGAGTAFDNDFRNTTLSGRLNLAPGAATAAAVTAHYSDGKYSFPTDGAGAFVDRNSFTVARVLTLGADVRHLFAERWRVNLLAFWNHHDGRFNDSQDGAADTLGFYQFISRDLIDRRGADLRFDFQATARTIVTIGGGLEHQAIESVSNSNSQFGPANDGSNHTRQNRAVYAQALTGAGSLLSVNAGVRLDDNDNFGTHFTYRGGVVVHAAPGSRVRASIGTGFKEPTFFENFASGFATGNPGLKPEESFSGEGGFEQDLPVAQLRVGVTYFYQEFTNLVQYTFTPPAPGGSNYFNVGAARSSGLEVTAAAVPVPGLSLAADLSLMDTEVTDAGFEAGDPDATFAEGQRLLRRPATGLGVRVEYAGDVGGVSLRVRHTGSRIDRDFSAFPATRVALAPHTLVAAAVRFNAFSGGPLTLTVKGENLTNVRYFNAVGFPAPGRTVLGGAEFAF